MTLEQSAKLVHDDGEDTEIESDCDVDDSGRDVMEVAPGDTSGVLTFTLFIPPSSVTLDSTGGGDGGKSICASVILCTLFSG